MAVFYLIRHGLTDWNQAGRIQGQLDIALTDVGREQAHRVGKALLGKGIEYIYTSDLSRARETAEIIARRLAIPISGACRDLREINFGRWEGMAITEIQAADPEGYARWRRDTVHTPVPAGESFRILADRVLGCLSRLGAEHPRDKVAVVTHGGPIVYILGAITGSDPNQRPPYRVANCSITTVSYHPDTRGWQAVQVGDTRHLDPGPVL